MNLQPSPPPQPRQPSMEILGVPVVAMGWQEALDILGGYLRNRFFMPVGFLNAHNANVACADREFARALDSFLVLPDGVGVDIAAKWLHGRPFPANLNGTDFVPALIASISSPLKVALLGATQENAGGAAEQLSALAPQHEYRVIHDGYFTKEQEPDIIADIADYRPDILLVAMGVPRQELWIERNLTSIHCTMPIAVGALLDFLSGRVPRAPLWVRRLRLEWLYRLWIEPGRLWRRYVVGNPLFLARVLAQKFGGYRAGTERVRDA
ncbi:WecB/TagA/CpsF family glycosyltransferase [Mesorhizobium sp. J428]|uniref:WecB/TagA/CpsF family glycosyltransferase n=1 Tax=Mesorhizobium sp. J428 TaxID=2898440 RepID=UPI002150A46E|nr:WecB/TagA/CpsF family glycosyltransferase [Mesorhizobium sp. J428]MCR5858397.1 WecB/TagA/CpsF family glycosyltransferase [Mesorhizobium sp. J428]